MDGQTEELVLDLSWLLEAPRERIFGLLTEPAQLARWWGPEGFTVPEIELDLRAGGRYRFTMQPPDGDAFHLSGEFLVVDPPSRLAYTFQWDEPAPDDRETVVRLSLRVAGAGTELLLRQGAFATAERLALHRGGWSDSLAKLRQLVGPGSADG